MERIFINQIPCTIVETKKFKTITLLFGFLGDLSRENITSRILLARLLSKSTKTYNTKKKIIQKTYELYDASVFVTNLMMYKTNATIFNLSIVHPSFIHNDITQNAFDFLKDMIYHPNIVDDGFDVKEFEEEKRNLRDKITSLYNNKGSYAAKRLLEEMGKGDLMGVSSSGTLEDLETITPQSLYALYQSIIATESVRLYVLGDIQASTVQVLLHGMQLNHLIRDYEIADTSLHQSENVREIVESQPIHQTQLMMGFRMNLNYFHPLYIAGILFSMMFGGMATSDLFEIIREKLGLAYHIYSTAYFDFQVFIVGAGIHRSSRSLVQENVLSILNEYKQGHINPHKLSMAKATLISSLKEKLDEPSDYLVHIVKHSLIRNESIADLIERVTHVTMEDVVEATQSIYLDTIYCLQGEEDD